MSGAVKWDLPTLPNPSLSDLESVWHEQRLESSTTGKLNDCCLLILQSLIQNKIFTGLIRLFSLPLLSL